MKKKLKKKKEEETDIPVVLIQWYLEVCCCQKWHPGQCSQLENQEELRGSFV